MKNSGVFNYVCAFLIVMLVIAAVALLLPAWHKYRSTLVKESRTQAKLDREKSERERQYRKKLRLENSPAEIEKVAREKYNFVKPGETVLKYAPANASKEKSR